MTFEEIKRDAIEMGVQVEHAVSTRIRRLYECIKAMVDDFEETDTELVWYYVNRDLQEIIYLKKELFNWHVQISCEHSSRRGRELDEFMIQNARNYPIDKLIEFTNGFALARCHDDTKPSLHHDKKHNRAHCFVCDKSWNPIDWMMEFEAKSFAEAVLFVDNKQIPF